MVPRLRTGWRGNGTEISVTGDEVVTETTGEDLDLLGRVGQEGAAGTCVERFP